MVERRSVIPSRASAQNSRLVVLGLSRPGQRPPTPQWVLPAGLRHGGGGGPGEGSCAKFCAGLTHLRVNPRSTDVGMTCSVARHMPAHRSAPGGRSPLSGKGPDRLFGHKHILAKFPEIFFFGRIVRWFCGLR